MASNSDLHVSCFGLPKLINYCLKVKEYKNNNYLIILMPYVIFSVGVINPLALSH